MCQLYLLLLVNLHNVSCFRYFIPMSYGITEKVPLVVSPSSWIVYHFPIPGFHQVLFVDLQEILYQLFFALIRLFQNIMYFQSETNFFYQLLAGRFPFCCFVYISFLGHLSQFFYHETTNSFIFAFRHSFLLALSSNHVA